MASLLRGVCSNLPPRGAEEFTPRPRYLACTQVCQVLAMALRGFAVLYVSDGQNERLALKVHGGGVPGDAAYSVVGLLCDDGMFLSIQAFKYMF